MKTQVEIVVINKLGLHARAAAKLVKLCANYQSTITLSKGDKSVDAKSIMGVLMLAAAQESVLMLRVDGDDADEATQAVCDLFSNYFDEGE